MVTMVKLEFFSNLANYGIKGHHFANDGNRIEIDRGYWKMKGLTLESNQIAECA